jgi:type IV secretory pathway TrbL component
MANERTKDTNPDPITGQPGAHPVGVAGGGAIGAVAGGAAGKGAAEMVNPTAEEAHWRQQSGKEYDQYAPAYRYGWESAARNEYQGRRFDDIEKDLEKNWSKARGTMKTEWKDARQRTRDAFERVQNNMSPGVTRASETNKRTL